GYVQKQVDQVVKLIAQLESRQRELNLRTDLYRWLARAVGRDENPAPHATDQRLIELLVGLDFSDRGERAGPMFYGNFQRASSIAQIQDYRDFFTRAAGAFAGNDPGFRWWGDVIGHIDFDPLNQSRTPQTYLAAPLPIASE